MRPLLNETDLEDELCLPSPGAVETLRRLDGDLLILGAGGKMGPSLARMARRAFDAAGLPGRRVIAVSRFSDAAAAEKLREAGIETLSCDLLDRAAVAALPEAAGIIFMAGQKFGTHSAPELTWMMNTVVPAIVAERYAGKARMVVFSTACVYPLVAATGPGADETHALNPPGEYAASCVGRERVFAHYCRAQGGSALFYRLSYAIDLRYGVIHDVARKVAAGEPVDVTMGYANVIWQGDANARALQCLDHVASPPAILNVTGLEKVSIRSLAEDLGQLLGRAPQITGQESSTAWLFDASRSYALFGPPRVGLREMVEATAAWVRQGGASLGKPTHFESRDGHF